jgi:Uma2 family endonuclease
MVAITYRELLKLYPTQRVELFDGMAVFMAGVNKFHTRLTTYLSGILHKFWRQEKNVNKYMVFHAPFDVLLFPDSNDPLNSRIMVQPDLGVALLEKLRDNYICGAPELIIEITSSNLIRDTKHKYDLYERAKVKEYWIISPKEKVLNIFTLKDGKYGEPIVYEFLNDENMIIESVTIENFEVSLHELFDYRGLE